MIYRPTECVGHGQNSDKPLPNLVQTEH